MAFDSTDADDAPRPPISLHPAFPAVVAAWFATLAGIGSIVLPVVLLERIVGLTGIAALIPAASPPLGLVARGLIGFAAALAGAGVGLVIARRVAGAQDPDRFAYGGRRPISVNDELGGEALVNGYGLPVTNERALAITEDDCADDSLYLPPFDHNEDEWAPATEERQPAAHAAEQPLELHFPAESHTDHAAALDEEEPMPFKQDMNEPLPFAAPSLARNGAQATPEPPAAEAAPEPAPPAPQPFRGDWAEGPVGELGLVQLVQRLEASIERRRERVACATMAAPLPAPPAGIEPAPAEEAAQAMAAYFGKPAEPLATFAEPETPAAMEDEFDQGDSGENYGSLLAIRHPAAPADADAALRAALATLQRMSGAA